MNHTFQDWDPQLCNCFFPWPCCTACRLLGTHPGIEPGPSAVKVWSPNHWTAREFPQVCNFLKLPDGFVAASPMPVYKISFVISVLDQDGHQRSGSKLWNQHGKMSPWLHNFLNWSFAMKYHQQKQALL